MRLPVRSSRLTLAALLLLGCALPLCAEQIAGVVDRVTDGDTLTIHLKKGRHEKVRLQGIDAPELDQAYGKEAARVLEDLVRDRKVNVQCEGRDDYGRVLGYVYLKNHSINLEMVKRGAAWHYVYYAKDNKALASAEKAAREAKRGLWKDEAPVAPWDYRHEKKAPAPAKTADIPAFGSVEGTCTRVTDGDTLTIQLPDGQRAAVQLFGIDAPEPAQEHGPEATAALEELVLHKTIRVIADGRDEFDRLKGKVYVGGQYVNLALVEKGHAWHSDKYGPNEDDLREAQQKARAAGQGLWATPGPTEPWRFRNGE